MKSFESILGKREKSDGVILVGSDDRDSLASSIMKKYNEKAKDILLLFEYKYDAKGWLVKTRSRLIFALTQNINQFRNFLEIKWVIDDLQNTNFDLRIIDENEIQIAEGRTILFDVGLYSQDRILREINKFIEKIDNIREINEDIRRKIRIHPKIWRHIVKMWAHYYGNKVEDVLYALPIRGNPEELERLGPLKFLGTLSLEDSLVIFKDLLENEEVERDKYDNWNYFGDYIKEWRPQLISYLKENGIEYNEESKKFSLIGGEPIEILTTKRKLTNLLEIEFNEFFYDNLKSEINRAYQLGLFTSAMLLSRKLLENLIIEILRKKYPPNVSGNLEIYYRIKENRFHDFSILLKNLEEKKDDFGIDNNIIAEFISLVKTFRPRANSNAHSIIVVSDEEEILNYNVSKMTALLLKLWKNLNLET